MTESYRQELPALKLSIERYTESVPDDGAWYLIENGDLRGRYRSLKAAQAAWREILDERGWRPPARDVDTSDIRHREQSERWSRNRGGD